MNQILIKDPYETKHQLPINKGKLTGLESLNDSKVLIEYLLDMDNIYKNIEEYNPKKPKNIDCIW